MHPRNPYFNNQPDYSKIADIYPDLKQFLHHHSKSAIKIDFKDINALKSLCCGLLKYTFSMY